MSSSETGHATWAEAAHRIPQDRMRIMEVDGVPVLHSATPGDATYCALIFRVGYADEEYARSGITHLLEHLALFGWTSPDVHMNGQTDEYFTTFHFHGSSAGSVSFLADLTRALRNLPEGRIAQEKDVLRTEWQGRGGQAVRAQRVERYGLRGPGLCAAGEIGLHHLDQSDLRSWSDRYFTSGNAVAVFSGAELPQNLTFDLPAGDAQPVPLRPSLGATLPAYFHGPDGLLLLDGEVTRSAAASMLSGVIQRTLLRRLRTEKGISYNVEADYAPMDDRTARVTVHADSRAAHHEELVETVLTTLEEFRAGRFDADDIEAQRAEALRLLAEPAPIPEMMSAAFRLMQGHVPLTHDALLKGIRDVDVSDLAVTAEEFWRSLLLQIPAGMTVEHGFNASPTGSSDAVSGESHRLMGGTGEVLHLAVDGVTLSQPDGRVWTARFAETVGLLKFPDGGRRLVSSDGFMVVVEPGIIPSLTSARLAALDAEIPAENHVDLPERPADSVPRLSQVAVAERVRGFGPWGDVLGALSLIVMLITIWIMNLLKGDQPALIVLAVVATVCFFVFLFGSRRLRRFDSAFVAQKKAVQKERQIRAANEHR